MAEDYSPSRRYASFRDLIMCVFPYGIQDVEHYVMIRMSALLSESLSINDHGGWILDPTCHKLLVFTALFM